MCKSLIIASAKAQRCLGDEYINNESPTLNWVNVIRNKKKIYGLKAEE